MRQVDLLESLDHSFSFAPYYYLLVHVVFDKILLSPRALEA